MNPAPYYKNTHFIIRTALIVAMVLVVWRLSTVTEFLREGLSKVVTPVWRAEQNFSEKMESFTALFSSKRALLQKNAALQEEILLLNARLNLLPLVREENREMKEILGRRVPGAAPILALILARPGRTPYDTFVIDKGSRDGIGTGDVVTAYDGIVIGAISRTNAGTSVVKLFSSPGERTEILLGKENIPTEAEGIGGGNFRVMLPKELNVKNGDMAITLGTGTELLGVVESVEASPADSFQKILFQTPVNMYTLKWVEVQKENNE